MRGVLWPRYGHFRFRGLLRSVKAQSRRSSAWSSVLMSLLLLLVLLELPRGRVLFCTLCSAATADRPLLQHDFLQLAPKAVGAESIERVGSSVRTNSVAGGLNSFKR